MARSKKTVEELFIEQKQKFKVAQAKKTVEELFNEQPAYVKKLINFLVNEAYKQGYRDASKNDSKNNKLEGLKIDRIIVDE